MRLALIAIAILISIRSAEAGPWCGSFDWFAPAKETVLPVSPLIAHNMNDRWYGGERDGKESPPPIIATIDGKRVSFKTQDIRTKEGVIRLIRITSRRVGKLELSTTAKGDKWHAGGQLLATYTIANDAPAIEQPTITVSRGQDSRLSPYHRIGELAIMRADAPVVAFTLKWRRDPDDEWRVRPLEAWISGTNDSEAHVGQSMCGMVENVPLAFLEAGVEAQLTAKLPDGRDVAIDLPNPFVIPPISSQNNRVTDQGADVAKPD